MKNDFKKESVMVLSSKMFKQPSAQRFKFEVDRKWAMTTKRAQSFLLSFYQKINQFISFEVLLDLIVFFRHDILKS